ncbi:MAG: aminotransferase [Clostridium sp.]|nr:aminotransferase [Clostridium sp.]
MKKEIIQIQILSGGKLPLYANYNDAGADVIAAEDLILHPGEAQVLPLNIKVAVPDGMEMQVRPRSGLSLKTHLRIPNTPGTVDSGYRDSVGVILENTFDISSLSYQMLYDDELRENLEKNAQFLFPTDKNSVYTTYANKQMETPEILALAPFLIFDKQGHPYGTLYIPKGMKVAQVVFNEIIHGVFEEIDDISIIGKNRGGGYGSTGIK